MDFCKGFENWLECQKCPYLCSSKCPVEGDNVMEKMRVWLRLLYSSAGKNKQEAFNKLG